MTQKELAKKLKVASYHAEDKWWDLIEVKRLLRLVNRMEAKIISSNPPVMRCRHDFGRIVGYRSGKRYVMQCRKCGATKVSGGFA